MNKLSITIFALFLSTSGVLAQEYKYHPLFIYTFSKSIEWPSSSNNNDFTICVVGSEQAYQQMLSISQKKKMIKNQNLVVKKCKSLEEVGESNIVFITKDTKVTSQEISERLSKSGILVITEHRGMAEQGSHINFVATAGSKIGFELNTTSTQNAGLKVASTLATLAIKTY